MAVAFALLLLSFSCLSHASEQIHLSFGPHESQMMVTWVSSGSKPNNSLVSYGMTKYPERHQAIGSWSEFRPSPNRLLYVHRATLTDLLPNTTYAYAIQDDGKTWSNSSTFKTLDPQAEEYTIAVFGDMGSENARAAPFLQRGVEGNAYDAIFHVGDMAYDMSDDEGRVGDDFMNLIEPMSRKVPYQVLPGNHEQANNFSHYDNVFTMMGSGASERNNFYYSTNIGPVHIISITDDFYFFYKDYGFGQIVAQYNWLKKDLEEANRPENRKIRPWIILLSHRPMYCSAAVEWFITELETVRHGINGSYGLEQVIKDFKVDLFVAGHVHLYERTYPVFEGKLPANMSDPYTDPEHPVHVITGAGGCKHGLLPFLSLQPDFSAERISEYSYSVLRVSRNKLFMQQISAEDGRVIDTFEIRKTLSD